MWSPQQHDCFLTENNTNQEVELSLKYITRFQENDPELITLYEKTVEDH